MTELLSWLLSTAVTVFAVTSMLSVGFGHTMRQVVGPLSNVRAVIRALIANFVLVPGLALLVLRLMPLPQPHAIGIFLIATAAGAPFLIKLAEAAEGDVALSATLLVLLLPATIIYMPVVVPLALPEAAVSASTIASPLLVTMLLPLGAGLAVRQFSEKSATDSSRWLRKHRRWRWSSSCWPPSSRTCAAFSLSSSRHRFSRR